MPYVSRAQQGYFHTHENEIGKGVVQEFDQASKGQKGLPYRVPKQPKAERPTTHNSPPALSKFASNNTSRSDRNDLNPPPGDAPMIGARQARVDGQFDKATKGIPGKVKGPNTLPREQAKPRFAKQDRVNAPASTGNPGRKPPQRATAGLLDPVEMPGSLTSPDSRMQSLFMGGMISNRTVNKMRAKLRNSDRESDNDASYKASY